MCVEPVPTRGSEQRGRGRGRGRGNGATENETSAHSVGQSLYGKDKFTWNPDPPSVGRRREQDIIRQAPGITSLARTNANNLADTLQFFVTQAMIDDMVL